MPWFLKDSDKVTVREFHGMISNHLASSYILHTEVNVHALSEMSGEICLSLASFQFRRS